ncbi:MAG: 7-cyano-7-deazaguanine synthase QueC [Legionella sp. 21-45-4]|nr:MAG: 7-cyano-7-deazaguanine synthase QueC [Legionella sp. 21-45-4]
MKPAVILLSGGLDSTTCLAYAKSQGFTCFALTVAYGQKHHAELAAAARITTQFNVTHEIITVPIGHLGGSALTDSSIDVPNHDESSAIPITYVPARNTIMLSLALGWAEVLHADNIFIGTSAVDYSGYPDCRPEYIHAFEVMANLATKRALNGDTLHINTPLMQLSKAETIQLGSTLGVDYSQTISCYRATSDGLACGNCSSCFLRKKGFLEAGVSDPTRYEA